MLYGNWSRVMVTFRMNGAIPIEASQIFQILFCGGAVCRINWNTSHMFLKGAISDRINIRNQKVLVMVFEVDDVQHGCCLEVENVQRRAERLRVFTRHNLCSS